MAKVTRIDRESREKSAARAVLGQMYGYYAYDWQPFSTVAKQAA